MHSASLPHVTSGALAEKLSREKLGLFSRAAEAPRSVQHGAILLFEHVRTLGDDSINFVGKLQRLALIYGVPVDLPNS